MSEFASYRTPPFHLSGIERLKWVLANVFTDPDSVGFDAQIFAQTSVIAASSEEGTATFELTVTPHLCNKTQNLHGGAAATIMDRIDVAVAEPVGEAGLHGWRARQSDVDVDVSEAGAGGNEGEGAVSDCEHGEEHGAYSWRDSDVGWEDLCRVVSTIRSCFRSQYLRSEKPLRWRDLYHGHKSELDIDRSRRTSIKLLSVQM